MEKEFDFIVIGAGSGGVRAARMAASHGAKVAIIEERFYGGTCVNVGCVPKKLFSYGAHFPDTFALAADYGYDVGEWSFDWATLRDNKTREIERLNGIYERLLENAGVTIFNGHGKVIARGEVMVGDMVLTAKHILIAVGGKPFLPPVPGIEHALISDDLFYLPALPKRVAVVGGGYIATEFAGILHGLGCKVTQLYRGDLFLKGFDKDIRAFVAEQMTTHGVSLRFNCDVSEIIEQQGAKTLRLDDGEELEVDEVFYATGRIPKLDDLFADGVSPALTSKGAIQVDEQFQTSLPGLYAVGDVIDRMQLTPVALAEGMWLAAHLFSAPAGRAVQYDMIPTAVFSHPNIGTIGLSEEQALEAYDAIRVYRSEFKPMRYTLGNQHSRCLIKLIVEDASDRVVGLHIAGEDAPEITQGFAVAMKMGATKADFDATIGIHPTAAEELVTLRQSQRVTR